MSKPFIQKLQAVLSESSLGDVTRGLRHDSLVWDKLQNDDFGSNAIQIIGNQPKNWNPAAIALLELDQYNLLENLYSSQETQLNEKLRHKAAGAFEDLNHANFLDKPSLSQAGLGSLWLREMWRLHSSWEPVINELGDLEENIWRTIFACLYGIVPEPNELVIALLQSSDRSTSTSLGIHVLASNPISTENQCSIILNYFENSNSRIRLVVLREANRQIKGLGKMLAVQLVNSEDKYFPEPSNDYDIFEHLLEKSELYQISGNYEKAIPILDDIWELSKQLQIDLNTKLARSAVRDDDPNSAIQAIERADNLDEKGENSTPDITLLKIHTGQLIEPSLNSKNIEKSDPISLLANANIALQNNHLEEAQSLSKQAYEGFIRTKKQNPSLFTNSLLDHVPSLTQTLLDSDLPFDAIKAGEISLEVNPSDPEALVLLSKSFLSANEQDKALEAALSAFAMDQYNPAYLRNLAATYFELNYWKESMQQYEKIFSQEAHPNQSDLLNYAKSAIHNQQPDITASTAQRIIHENQSNSEAHALLGEALVQIGDPMSAVTHLNQAVALEPQSSSAWRTLAKIHIKNDDRQKAKEILLSASQVVKNDPEIHYLLGLEYQKEDQAEKALGEFETASQLIDSASFSDSDLTQDIWHQLGVVLDDQGQFAESEQTLGRGHQAYPTNPKIAHAYAKVLIKTNKVAKGLAALSVAMQNGDPTAGIYLDYAEAHLILGNNPDEALSAIQSAASLEPNNPKIKLFQAELNALKGEHESAISSFQELKALPNPEDQNWEIRTSIGLAKSAIAVHQPEIAIAALKDTLSSNPKDVEILKILCLANADAGLGKGAKEILSEVYHLSEDNLDDLIWVSDQSISMNDKNLAVKALNRAAEISPDKANILVRLGYVQLSSQDIPNATATFNQLFDAESVKTEDLKMAAEAFVGLGDITSSIPYLEKALELSDDNPADLLNDLSKAYHKTGNLKSALELAEKSIAAEPHNPKNYQYKIQLLMEMERPKAALAAVQDSLELTPNDPALHLLGAELMKIQGDYKAALDHIETVLSINSDHSKGLKLAAELNFSCLQEDRAKELLNSINEHGAGDEESDLLEIHLTIESEDSKNINSTLDKLKAERANHPYYLAVHSGILADQLKFDSAAEEFDSALINYESEESTSHNRLESKLTLLALNNTALKLKEWDSALYLARKLKDSSPSEPKSLLTLIQTLILRAEHQHLCKTVGVIKHSPGQKAVSKSVINDFKESVKSAVQSTPDGPGLQKVLSWKKRGELALDLITPDIKTAKGIVSELNDSAGILASFIRHGDLNSAIIVGENNTDQVSVLFQTSLALLEVDPHKSFTYALQTVELDPNNPLNLALIAKAAHKNSELELAIDSINKALEIWEDEPNWHKFAGQLYQELGITSSAIEHIKEAAKLDPENGETLTLLGKAYLRNNQPKRAIKSFTRANTYFPDDPDILKGISTAHAQEKDFAAAATFADKLIKLDKNNIDPLLIRANIDLEANKPKNAKKYIDKAIKIDPNNLEALQLKAKELQLSGEVQEAVKLIDKAISTADNPIPLLLHRAELIKIHQGKDAGLNTLIALSGEFPENPEILAKLSSEFMENGQSQNAIKTAQDAISNNNNQLDQNQEAKLHFLLGSLLRESGQLDQSIHHLNETILKAPGFMDAYLEIGHAHRDSRRHGQALEFYNQAIEISPNDARSYQEAGIILKEIKDYSSAENMLRQASMLDPKDIGIQRQLGAVIALNLVHRPPNAEAAA